MDERSVNLREVLQPESAPTTTLLRSPPYQTNLDTFFDDPHEEATEDEQAVALADAGEAGVVGQGFELSFTRVRYDGGERHYTELA